MSRNRRRSLAQIGLMVVLTLSASPSLAFQHASQPTGKTTHPLGNSENPRPFSLGPLSVSTVSPSRAPQRFLNDFLKQKEHQHNDDNVYTSPPWTKASELQRRKEEWADRYTHVESLRKAFGSNHNKVWGDLDASKTRRLYKTLLPTSLMELVKVGADVEDLAPLAYEARVAAKLYARERSQVPARLAASLYDGFRQFRKYGRFQTKGMSYDQIWDKYEQAILQELDEEGLDEDDVAAKICLKILERSCVTNDAVDRRVLGGEVSEADVEDLAKITATLESDVRKLLDPAIQGNHPPKNLSLQSYRILRLVAKARRRAQQRKKLQQQQSSQ